MKSFQLVLGLLLAASAGTAQQYTISTVAGIPQDRGYFSDGSPATTVPLDFPLRVALDGKGNFYIIDFQGWIIRKVDAKGIITTVAGTGTPGYSGDNEAATSASILDVHSIAADANGNIYLADTANNRIRKVDSKGIITTLAGDGTRGYSGDGGVSTKARLYFPVGLALDSSGNLYVADYGNATVRKIAASGGNITTIAGIGAYGNSGDGGPANKAALAFPYGLAVDAAGNVYISDTGNQNIRKITSDGNIRTVATGVDAQSIAVDAAGNIFYANYNDHTVRQIRPDGTQRILAGNGTAGYSGDNGPATFAQLNNPYGIALDASGILYVADSGNHIIRTLTPAAVSVNGIVNAASNDRPGGYVSPGEIIVLYGAGLGPAQLVKNTPDASGNYGTQAGGTTVKIGGYPATVLYSSATQVAAIVPYELGLGSLVQAVVSFNGQTTLNAPLNVSPAAPGVFTVNGSGTGQAAAVNQDGSLNSTASPAPLGSTISLYVTGEGLTTPDGVNGKAATRPFPAPRLPVTVSIAGKDAVVAYAGAAPGAVAGLMQLNVQISTNLVQTLNFAAGPVSVPVIVTVGGFTSQTGVTIAVSSSGPSK